LSKAARIKNQVAFSFGVTGRHVDTTIISGRIIMKDRVLINTDEEALMNNP
jgi:hypothetical protein